MLELVDPDLLALIGSAAGARSAVAWQGANPSATRVFAPGIAVATDRTAFEALRREWRQLERTASGAVLFQSFDWCRAVFDHHLKAGNRFEPLIVTLRQGGRLVGLLPLQRRGSGLSQAVTGFGEPYQQYTDALIAPEAPKSTAARLLDAACRNATGCIS